MQSITFGELLENTRHQLNISKTSLCRGLCSVSSLCRYESDCFTPDIFIAYALLERLGINPHSLDFVISNANHNIVKLRNEINKYTQTKNWSKVISLINEYELQDLTSSINLHEQYILLKKSSISLNYTKDYATVIKLCTEGLSKTNCSFVLKTPHIKKEIYSDIEIQLYINLFYASYFSNDSQLLSYLNEMLNYMTNLIQVSYVSQLYLPYIHYLLSLLQKQTFELSQAMNHLQVAKQLLIKNYRIELLEQILTLQVELNNHKRKINTIFYQ